jgi:cell wall-associated NlpC family hydrolase
MHVAEEASDLLERAFAGRHRSATATQRTIRTLCMSAALGGATVGLTPLAQAGPGQPQATASSLEQQLPDSIVSGDASIQTVKTVSAAVDIRQAQPAAAPVTLAAKSGTSIEVDSPRAVPVGSQATFRATLTADGKAVANQPLFVWVQGSDRTWQYTGQLTTDAQGSAQWSHTVDDHGLTVSLWYRGTDALKGSFVGPLGVSGTALPAPQPAAAAAAAAPADTAADGNVQDTSSRQSASVSETRQRVLQLAASQAGKPYVFGAAGPSAFDCSGLVQWVFSRIGTNMPHNAAAQLDMASRTRNPQPGDLVFFDEGGGFIGHVGIYAGGGKFWNAPHTGASVYLAKLGSGWGRPIFATML